MPDLIEVQEAPPKSIRQRAQSSDQERLPRSTREPEIDEALVLGGLVNQIDEDDWLI
jgi:hypothetical protein